MTTSYSILATVTLQHDYYANGKCNDFELVPSAATAAALKGAGILTKTMGNTLILLIKTDNDGAAYIDLPADLRMTCYMRLSNPNFINFTNVPHQPDSVFYFTNLYGTKAGGTFYLNYPIPDLNDGAEIGDLLQEGGFVYEAIKPIPDGGHATNDGDFWYKRAANQYVHGKDLLPLTDGLLEVDTAAAKVFDIAIRGLNEFTLQYDVPVGKPERQEFSKNQESVIINMRGLPPGKYKVTVNRREQFVYVDAAASYARVFGIIDLYNLFKSTNALSLTDAAKHPRSLDYVIRFANRLAIWKYITRTAQVTGIEVTAVPDAFVPGPQPNQFLSALPMPLSQQPLKTLQLMKGTTILASKLANPPPDRISTWKDGGGNSYYCAEMYLNY